MSPRNVQRMFEGSTTVEQELTFAALPDDVKAAARAIVRNEVAIEMEDTLNEAREEALNSIEGRINTLKREIMDDLNGLRNFGLEIIQPQNSDQQATAQLYWQRFNKIADRVRSNGVRRSR